MQVNVLNRDSQAGKTVSPDSQIIKTSQILLHRISMVTVEQLDERNVTLESFSAGLVSIS